MLQVASAALEDIASLLEMALTPSISSPFPETPACPTNGQEGAVTKVKWDEQWRASTSHTQVKLPNSNHNSPAREFREKQQISPA